MERDTGAKIIIRGKGSVKEGKVGLKNGHPLPGEDEPLHAYVTATNLEAVRKAVERIKDVIKEGVDIPEGQNDLRKNQLRELALLNGTLREGEVPRLLTYLLFTNSTNRSLVIVTYLSLLRNPSIDF
jgi:splicing factor 1